MDGGYGWWKKSTVHQLSLGGLSHYLQGFSTIPSGDRRISEPWTVTVTTFIYARCFSLNIAKQGLGAAVIFVTVNTFDQKTNPSKLRICGDCTRIRQPLFFRSSKYQLGVEDIETTNLKTNISHLGTRKINFKSAGWGDMWIPWKVPISVKLSINLSKHHSCWYPLWDFRGRESPQTRYLLISPCYVRPLPHSHPIHRSGRTLTAFFMVSAQNNCGQIGPSATSRGDLCLALPVVISSCKVVWLWLICL